MELIFLGLVAVAAVVVVDGLFDLGILRAISSFFGFKDNEEVKNVFDVNSDGKVDVVDAKAVVAAANKNVGKKMAVKRVTKKKVK